ncbi:heat-inducible transcriptional repressor HrcA [Mycoplasma phocoeninasale]|uniref:Heat-inducible transcription repressor HrcA n=1 Tax=Mycoplasma phocoeninasale TaxID=2726117 RepID=A0A858U4V3_9MOLU|nr:heat-inducible transcriptional repressor HrcA [Mycoplasma phocoeninasale]QJG66447.1 heat-inducible transcriptional repressor HrcA [Mycoplasma phocoeninasale]
MNNDFRDEKINAKLAYYFKLIVDTYIETGEPVGSQKLVEEHKLNCSSATIRNIMAELEKRNFLEKPHTSGGRVPSAKGLEYYARNLVYNPLEYFDERLEDLLAKRRISIDSTLDEAAKIVGQMAGFAVVATSNNLYETLKSIQLTALNSASAVVVLVTSGGNVQNKIFNFDKGVELNDLRIAVRLFKERLIDTPLIELASKIQSLSPIFSKQVKNYEVIMQKFIKSIFRFEEKIENKAFNKSAIILSEKISREEIAKLFDLIENHSVWEAIENNLDDESNIKLDVSRPNLNIISKKIDFVNSENIKEISIVGPKNLDFKESFEAIKILEKIIKDRNGEKNE